MNHIAIIHMGAIGDLVQALPAFRAIRMRWPEARITLISRPERAVLARMAGLVDACPDYDTAPAPDGADLVVDFLGGGSAKAAMRIGGPRSVVAADAQQRRDATERVPPEAPAEVLPARNNRDVITVNPLPPCDWTGPASEWIFREVSARLDLPRVPQAPEIPVPAAVLETARGVLAKAGVGGRFVAIHPGSGSLRKNWPLERFVEVARRLRAAGRQVVWLSGPAERDRGTLRSAGMESPLLAELPLDVVAGVLALADGYLGNDSGVTQIAAAVRTPDGRCTPTVAIFGPTDARIWGPRGGHVHVVRGAGGAMEDLPAGRILAAMAAILSPSPGR